MPCVYQVSAKSMPAACLLIGSMTVPMSSLLVCTTPPHHWIYPSSTPEYKAMEEYIEEALKQWYIWQSTSPAFAGFFFVEKTGRGLKPCTDNWGLYQITIKYHHPLPLVPSAIEQLCNAKMYTKFATHSANYICFREGDKWKLPLAQPLATRSIV